MFLPERITLSAGQYDSFFLKESFIIEPPTKDKKPKAIQWSNAFMYRAKEAPIKYPAKGIANWKPPKYAPNFSEIAALTFLKQTPFVTETAKASIAKAIETKNTEANLIYFHSIS
jgi:hypothetical protein